MRKPGQCSAVAKKKLPQQAYMQVQETRLTTSFVWRLQTALSWLEGMCHSLLEAHTRPSTEDVALKEMEDASPIGPRRVPIPPPHSMLDGGTKGTKLELLMLAFPAGA